MLDVFLCLLPHHAYRHGGDFWNVDFRGKIGDNEEGEDFLIGRGCINSSCGMNTEEVEPSNFKRHVRGALGNKIRYNRNILRLNGENIDPLPALRSRWINYCNMVDMSDEDSEDFSEIESHSHYYRDDPNVGLV